VSALGELSARIQRGLLQTEEEQGDVVAVALGSQFEAFKDPAKGGLARCRLGMT